MASSMACTAAKRAGKAAVRRLYATEALPQAEMTSVTRLPSGLRVTTAAIEGRFPALGLYVDSGSRYETEDNLGCSQLLDKLAFQRSLNRSTEQFTRQLIEYGGQFFHAGGRDCALFQATATDGNIEGALDLILDTTFQPSFDEDLLVSQKEAALYDNYVFNEKPELAMNEKLLDVAWRGNTLGNPWPADDAKLQAITPARLAAYHRAWFTPERMVIAAVGIQHERFVRLVERLLEPHLQYRASLLIPGAALTSKSAVASAASAFRSPIGTQKNLSTTPSHSATEASDQPRDTASLRPVYTGGMEFLHDPEAEFTRLLVGYESLPLYDPDLYALAVLHVLLGGGSSFSSGGPGKGMYSRFYTDILARHRIVDHCASLHSIFADAGLFGCHIAVTSEDAKRAAPILAEGLASAIKKGDRYKAEQELSRARNQLQMTLLQALESRAVQVEDLGRQVLQLGRREPDEEMCAKIQAVTLADLQRVADRVLRHGKPSIVGYGNVDKLGDIEAVLKRHGLGSSS